MQSTSDNNDNNEDARITKSQDYFTMYDGISSDAWDGHDIYMYSWRNVMQYKIKNKLNPYLKQNI